jgi:hypothetical protein
MLKKWLAKLGLGRHADDESYGAETKAKEARRVQDGIDSSRRTPTADDAPSAEQTDEESPAGS